MISRRAASRGRPGPVAADTAPASAPTAGTFTSPDTAVSSGHCYRYTFTIADKVGNVVHAVSVTAKVDAERADRLRRPRRPSSPAPATSTTTPARQTQFFRPARLRLVHAERDRRATPSPGITQVAFPDVSGVSGWTGSTGGSDTTSPYSLAGRLQLELRARPLRAPARSSRRTVAVIERSDTITLAADSAGPTGQSVTLTGRERAVLRRRVGDASRSRTATTAQAPASTRRRGASRARPATLAGEHLHELQPRRRHVLQPRHRRLGRSLLPLHASRSPTTSATSRARSPRPRRSTPARRRSRSARPTELTGAGNQYYDAGTKTLFFRPTGSGSFDLNATASDTDTAVDAVAFPTISASAAGADRRAAPTRRARTPHRPTTGGARRGGARRADRLRDRQGRELVLGHDHDRRRHDAPTGQSITLTGADLPPTTARTRSSFSLANGSDNGGGAGLDLASATVTRETGTLSR